MDIRKQDPPSGHRLLCLTYIFTFRFFIEYTKDVQEAFEEDMMFNMGQLLSIPFIIIGVWCMLRAKKKS